MRRFCSCGAEMDVVLEHDEFAGWKCSSCLKMMRQPFLRTKEEEDEFWRKELPLTSRVLFCYRLLPFAPILVPMLILNKIRKGR